MYDYYTIKRRFNEIYTKMLIDDYCNLLFKKATTTILYRMISLSP